jgi:hypothetical protein
MMAATAAGFGAAETILIRNATVVTVTKGTIQNGSVLIENGKIANLVVTKGDAFDDRATVEYVFVDGMEFEPGKDLPAAGGAGAGGGGGTRRQTTPPPQETLNGGKN